MKLKLRMYTKTSGLIKVNLITNKKVIGKFKDEAAGIPVVEFLGLRSKM